MFFGNSAKSVRHCVQNVISAALAERCIHVLEMLHVDQEQPDIVFPIVQALIQRFEQRAAIRQLGQEVRARHLDNSVAFNLQSLNVLFERCLRIFQRRIRLKQIAGAIFKNPLGFLASHSLAGRPLLQELQIRERRGSRVRHQAQAFTRVKRTFRSASSSLMSVLIVTFSPKVEAQPCSKP